MSKRTHPEKKWAAGTNESKAQDPITLGQISLVVVGLLDATLGALLQVTGGGLWNHCYHGKDAGLTP